MVWLQRKCAATSRAWVSFQDLQRGLLGHPGAFPLTPACWGWLPPLLSAALYLGVPVWSQGCSHLAQGGDRRRTSLGGGVAQPGLTWGPREWVGSMENSLPDCPGRKQPFSAQKRLGFTAPFSCTAGYPLSLSWLGSRLFLITWFQ